MSIEKISNPITGIDMMSKINEIIETINKYDVVNPCVSSLSVSGTTITVTKTDSTTSTLTTTDTVYGVAVAPSSTESGSDGLMSKDMVKQLSDLADSVTELSNKVKAATS